ncbi:MAG: murein biosynthesis integral membrane protein MurJ [bacterium]|nr:murein biosynthesis integral membrane protein MurJ [bacterium]
MKSSRALSNKQIFLSAFVVLLGFLASGVLGFVRTAVFSATFGTSAELDAFYAAQRIPELLFTLVAGGALGSAFIPVFSRYLKPESLDHAWKLASAVMSFSFLIAGGLGVLLAIFAPIYVPIVLVPSASASQQALVISLTQLMMTTTAIFAVSGLIMGILNAHQQFIFSSLALSLNNIGLIMGALLIAPNLAPYDGQTGNANIYGLAFGAILGASLHLVVQLPGLYRVKARLRLLLTWQLAGVREILGLMLPRVLGLAVVQLNFLVNVALASGMAEGSQTALSTAWFLLFFVLGIIAQSLGTVIFPTLSALVAENDMTTYKARLALAMRSVLFLALPATAGLILMGVPLVSLFERGEWTATSTRATAWALSFFAIGMAGHSLLEVLSRAFYALADTWTPVKIGLASMVSNIVLSLIFIQFIGDKTSLERGAFAGLALANSLTTLIEAGALWWLLHRRLGGMPTRRILDGALRALIATIGMSAVVWGMTMTFTDMPMLLLLLIGAGGGAIAYFIFAVLLRINELDIILVRLKLKKR